MSTAVAQKVINFSGPIHLHGWDGGIKKSPPPPICPNERPTNWALGGPTDAGNSEAGELGGDGLSWEDGGLLNYKEKGKSSSLFNALTAIINFLVYTVLLEPQIQQREQGILMILIDRWCPGLPQPCSAHDLVKCRNQDSSLISKPGAFVWPSRPLVAEQQSWERHCDLKLRKCGLPTFFLAAWHLGILLKHLREVATGKQAVSWSLRLIVLSLSLWAGRGRSMVGGTPHADSQIPQLGSLAGRLRRPQAEWCSRRLQLRA